MEIGHIIPHIEALIFASDRPLTTADITELINLAFGFMEDKVTLEQVDTSLEGIREKYDSEFYPFELRESGGGWQFLTKKEFHKTVAQLNGEKFLKRLSNAALETLAIIAYKQPITKADIESIRGVSCDYSIQKLLEKELIVITGRNEELPGKPLVYVTSKSFMDYFGLNSPDDLPKLKEVFDEVMVNPTTMANESATENPDSEEPGSTEDSPIALVVTENGELLEESSAALNNDSGNSESTDMDIPSSGIVSADDIGSTNEDFGQHPAANEQLPTDDQDEADDNSKEDEPPATSDPDTTSR